MQEPARSVHTASRCGASQEGLGRGGGGGGGGLYALGRSLYDAGVYYGRMMVVVVLRDEMPRPNVL